MDFTFIKPKNGKKFPANSDDWEWWEPSAPENLKKLSAAGFKIVVFTNQGGVKAGKTTVAELTSKFKKIQAALGIPMTYLAATDEDMYRKPSPEMWKYFVTKVNGNIKINTDLSFYCGDAAGRPKTNTKPKDFSDGDLKFALNAKLPFFLPEDVLGSAPQALKGLLEGQAIDQNKKQGQNEEEEKVGGPGLGLDKADGPIVKGGKKGDELKLAKGERELVVFIGSPGSGKSTFYHQFMSSYVHVNNDTLKTKEKCMKVCKEALMGGKSVVIDNQNHTAEVRNRYISIAKELGVPVRAFLFDTSKEVCMHNNN